jgi:hypothetical protein
MEERYIKSGELTITKLLPQATSDSELSLE